MFTDAKRLQQVLKNLLSNAFKFTHEGHVTLAIEAVKAGWSPQNESLNRAPTVIAFSVTDTGIGISPDKQQIIFEAFQQADGSTSRKYGGTGLGLAISRELSRLLGGEIRLVSAPRAGSTFTLYLPVSYVAVRAPRAGAPAQAAHAIRRRRSRRRSRATAETSVRLTRVRSPIGRRTRRRRSAATPSSRCKRRRGSSTRSATTATSIEPGDEVLLIVENDLGFARFLLDTAREQGFKGIVTSLGVAALALADKFKPAAITLDLFLPDIDGWRVLDRLKNDSATRHIPVAVISTDESRDRALNSGAHSFVAKPIQSKEVLDGLLDDLKSFTPRRGAQPARRRAGPGEGERARAAVRRRRRPDLHGARPRDGGATLAAATASIAWCSMPTCASLDGELPDGAERDESARGRLPIIVYGGTEDAEVAQRLAAAARSTRSCATSVRPSGCSSRRACSCIAISRRCRRRIATCCATLHDSDEVLQGKRVMIVDDDMRNIFALTSLLEDHGMVVVSHDNGRDAIRYLQAQPDIDVVLMDIMMPEMDGIDTIREIRKIPQCKDLPIIAVTAKAMKGDREKCIEAGAWDYLSKPVDTGADARRAAGLAASLSGTPARRRPTHTPCREHRRRDELPQRPGEHPGRRRSARQARRLPVDPRGARPEPRHGASGRGGAAAGAEARLRGHPARRQHAGHGRARDRGADPRPEASAHVRSSSSPRTTATKCVRPRAIRSARSTSWSSPIVPEILRTKVKVFVDLYLLAQQAKHQARERASSPRERAARAAAERANEALGVPGAGERGALRLARSRRDHARARAARRAVPGRRRRAHGRRRRRCRGRRPKSCGPATCRRRLPGHRGIRRASIAAGGATRSTA